MTSHPIACLFPGQGSQSIGMLQATAEQFPVVLDVFATVSERMGYDLWQLCQEGPEDQLNQTEYTQVAMLAADVAMYQVFIQNQAAPQWMAGHSLGEYAALVCAQAIDLADAATLVAKRGQLMQAAIPLGQGAMAAIIGLTDEQVQTLCQQASDSMLDVSPANYNAIGQVVIAGHSAAVQQAIQLAEQAGARMAKLIPVSVPCHCSLLKEAADAFYDELQHATWRQPTCRVISNVDLSVYESIAQITSLLKAQLYSPVRWVETIQKLRQHHVLTMVECGPGKVLSGLSKRIDKSITMQTVDDFNPKEVA